MKEGGGDDPARVLHRTQQTLKSLEDAPPLSFAGSDGRFHERRPS